MSGELERSAGRRRERLGPGSLCEGFITETHATLEADVTVVSESAQVLLLSESSTEIIKTALSSTRAVLGATSCVAVL